MSENTSDRNGRALEYAVSLALMGAPNFRLTTQTLADNRRDASKFAELPVPLQNNYVSASQKIAVWAQQQIKGKVSIDRLGDKADDVVDIKLLSNQAELNLSLKHNHQALKHPRPYSFAQSCGYAKGTKEDLLHRRSMNNVDKIFRAKATNKSYFRDCARVVLDSLYSDVCNACATSLQNWMQNDKDVAENLFRFLVNTGFYKVIVETRPSFAVKIQDYSNISAPSAVTPSVDGNRLVLTFDNNWIINNRIHTASSRISEAENQLSLKFDAQRTAGAIIETII